MNEFIEYLTELIPEKDSLKIVKTEAKKSRTPKISRSAGLINITQHLL